MRMIEQIAAMLASIMGKRAAGKVVEAETELESAVIALVGLPFSKLKELSPEALRDRLNQSGGLRELRAIKLAELLLLDAQWQKGGASDVLPNKVHAFCLLADSLSALSSEEESFFRKKLEAIAQDLGELRKHPYIRERLHALNAHGEE
jgi:hypothetical protein